MNESSSEAPRSAGRPAVARRNLLGLRREDLARELTDWADRPFRFDQLYRALHDRRVTSIDDITDLSKDLRRALSERWVVRWPEVAERCRSEDGTVKYVLRLADGSTIEAVHIPDGDRRTLCISSQAGCALACSFCVTGYWGPGRNLDAGEIVGQVFRLSSEHPAPTSAGSRGFNLVFMGMGEPLLNLEAVRSSLEILSEQISLRRITVSTAGVVPGIEAMAQWPRRPNLAVSLHAADDDLRDRIMPINRRYPLADLFEALRGYPLERGRRLTFEYILIRDLNDGLGQADRLVSRLRGLRCKVNLIPMNPDPVLPGLERPSEERVQAFADRVVQEGGITCSVRRPRGDDVGAACGQLRAPGREPRPRAHYLSHQA